MSFPKNLGDVKYYFESVFNPRNSINVEIQDQYSPIVNLYLYEVLDTITLDVAASVDDTSITVTTTGLTPLVGQYVCLKEGVEFFQGRISSVTPVAGNQYTLGMNSPLDYPFTTSGGCSITSIDLNVDGSVTPKVFGVSPEALSAGIAWDITRMMLVISDSSSMDDGKFGGITGGLSNGIVFRVKRNGTRDNIFNARTNGDFRLQAYDLQYIDATLGPAGRESLGVRRSFNGPDKNGVAIRLVNDEDPDEFQLIVQDDLTLLDSFHMVIQGHVVQE